MCNNRRLFTHSWVTYISGDLLGFGGHLVLVLVQISQRVRYERLKLGANRLGTKRPRVSKFCRSSMYAFMKPNSLKRTFRAYHGFDLTG